MPIYPTFPYTPKLIKRGAERNIANPGAQDSYAPKQDLKESYSSSFAGKDSYYSPYNSFSKTPASSLPNYSASFPSNPFGSNPFGSSPFSSNPFGSTPFGANSFGANPYASLNSFGNAFQNSPLTQPPAAPFPPNNFPNYYPHPAYLPNFYNQYPPSFLPPGANYPNKNDDDDDDDDRKGKKGRGRYKEDDDDTQFKDGGNFLSSSSKDLDGQSSTYKGSGSFKSNSNLADKLNGIPGQSANLDLGSNSYVKSHQLEQLMRQTLIKLLAQSVAQQVSQAQYPIYDLNTNAPNQNIRNNDAQSYTAPSGLAKTGLSYVVNPQIINKPPNQLGTGQVPSTQLINKNPRFQDTQYQKAPGLFLTPLKTSRNPIPIPSPDYGDYETQPSQVDQNYQASSNQEQRTNFKSKSLPTQTSQTSSFEYSSYQPTPPTKSSEQKELENVSINFSNKKDNKRG